MREDSYGIFVPSNKTFYYLESGDIYVSNTLERLKTILTKRGILKLDITKIKAESTPHKIMTVTEAKINDLALEPIYISKHVQGLFTDKTELLKKSKWGKKDVD